MANRISIVVSILLLISYKCDSKQAVPVEIFTYNQIHIDSLFDGDDLPDPESLLDIIKEKQFANVRESYGKLAHECFTWNDLKRFIKKGIPKKITDQLKQDNQFLDVVLAVKYMNTNDREKLLKKCSRIARPTWAELGEISIKGQTDAGNEAELLIANEIVEQVRYLCQLELEQIKEMYQE